LFLDVVISENFAVPQLLIFALPLASKSMLDGYVPMNYPLFMSMF